jgi:threonine/homoserine/homoserine lactone efflux protein
MIPSDLIAFILFISAAAFSPGPNNFIASYSAFNFGIKKTLPIIYGVTFGFPLLIFCINFGLSIVFNKYPEIQKIITLAGTIFLVYMAYKIATTKNSENKEIKNPATFINIVLFQFINPKAVICAAFITSTFISQENFVKDSIVIIVLAIIISFLSIVTWSLLGKYMIIGESEKRLSNFPIFISAPLKLIAKNFNFLMSGMLILTIIILYL